MVYGSFDMIWLQDVLAIKPIFSCDEIYWSKEVNDALARETESGDMFLSYLILDSLDIHFSGKWGEVSQEIRELDDSVLKSYLNGDKRGILRSCLSDDRYCLSVVTFGDFSKTEIMFSSEYEHFQKN